MSRQSGPPLRLLWVATKLPWPPHDGGRLVQATTIEALAAAGVEITVVSPADPDTDLDRIAVGVPSGVRIEPVAVSPQGRLATAARAILRNLPWTVAMHQRRAVRIRIAERIEAAGRDGGFDVVHAEQIQAWPQTSPARRRGVPGVLRTQNVESDLWRAVAGMREIPAPVRRALRWESGRLRRWETKALRAADAVVALTRKDAERLASLAARSVGEIEIRPLSAIFPESLPPAQQELEGEPAAVLLGSGGWLPNRDARRWCLEELWPRVIRTLPGARLHVFGSRVEGEGVASHPAPDDSREAFAPGSVLVVPLRIASGVRMKILEAWARGIPVLATPEAAAGLEVEDGRELLLFRDGEELTSALRRLRGEPDLVARLIACGRQRLARRHSAFHLAAELVRIYRSVTG